MNKEPFKKNRLAGRSKKKPSMRRSVEPMKELKLKKSVVGRIKEQMRSAIKPNNRQNNSREKQLNRLKNKTNLKPRNLPKSLAN